MAVLSKPGAIGDIFDDLVFDTVQLDAPAWWLHLIFKVIFSDRAVYDEVCATCPLTFAEGLSEVLDCPTPPSLDYFRSLPRVKLTDQDLPNCWAVYAHIFEKAGRKPRLYIGSATAEKGAKLRLKKYESTAVSVKQPRFVELARKQGFVKTHTALLAWSKIPHFRHISRARQRYLGIEGVFQMLFFASIFNNYEPEWVDFMPWCREDVEWEPLCSHISFNECIRDPSLLDLDFEALDKLQSFKLAQKKARSKKGNRAYMVAHPAKRAASQRARHKKLTASRKYECKICDVVPITPQGLKNHINTRRHKTRVDNIARGESLEPGTHGRRVARLDARSLAEKRFCCEICDKVYPRATNLREHYKTKMHLKNAAEADAALEEGIESDDASDTEDLDLTDHTAMDSVQDGDSSIMEE
jgi:hypothetical protein